MTSKPAVLVVDNSLFNIEPLSALLSDSSGICFATSGEEAVKVAPDIRPDLILLDVVLPGIDDYEVCRRL